MDFWFATDVVAYLRAAGLPLKHIEVAGRWPDGLESRPVFSVRLSEFSDWPDVARSLRLKGDPETVVTAWYARQLAGTNARFVGHARIW